MHANIICVLRFTGRRNKGRNTIQRAMFFIGYYHLIVTTFEVDYFNVKLNKSKRKLLMNYLLFLIVYAYSLCLTKGSTFWEFFNLLNINYHAIYRRLKQRFFVAPYLNIRDTLRTHEEPPSLLD